MYVIHTLNGSLSDGYSLSFLHGFSAIFPGQSRWKISSHGVWQTSLQLRSGPGTGDPESDDTFFNYDILSSINSTKDFSRKVLVG